MSVLLPSGSATTSELATGQSRLSVSVPQSPVLRRRHSLLSLWLAFS